MGNEIDQELFARKATELRDRLASIKLAVDVLVRTGDETADLASKVLEVSQSLSEKWLTGDYAMKRRILEIVCLNSRLEDKKAGFLTRKPFDVLVEGLDLSKSRGNRI